MVEADGSSAVHAIAGSYVEFAERGVLDEFAHLAPEEIRREHRRDGFEAGNADKIFESTFRSQVDLGGSEETRTRNPEPGTRKEETGD